MKKSFKSFLVFIGDFIAVFITLTLIRKLELDNSKKAFVYLGLVFVLVAINVIVDKITDKIARKKAQQTLDKKED